MKVCSVPGCERPFVARGFCSLHYGRWQKHGDPQADIPPRPQGGNRPRKFCVVEGCGKRVNGHGYCLKHYQQMWNAGIEIPGANWTRCLVDSCERFARSQGYCIKHYQRLRAHGDPLALKIAERGAGHVNSEGYRILSVGGRNISEHRYVMEQHLGRQLRPNESVHHRDGDKLNNDIENLELFAGNHVRGARIGEGKAHCPTCTCFHHG